VHQQDAQRFRCADQKSERSDLMGRDELIMRHVSGGWRTQMVKAELIQP
jgi:hypothetical protein